MRDTLFKASVLVVLVAIAIGVWLHTENGRYQFVKADNYEIVRDTRTGQYWIDANTVVIHVDPLHNRVDTRQVVASQKLVSKSESAGKLQVLGEVPLSK